MSMLLNYCWHTTCCTCYLTYVHTSLFLASLVANAIAIVIVIVAVAIAVAGVVAVVIQ